MLGWPVGCCDGFVVGARTVGVLVGEKCGVWAGAKADVGLEETAGWADGGGWRNELGGTEAAGRLEGLEEGCDDGCVDRCVKEGCDDGCVDGCEDGMAEVGDLDGACDLLGDPVFMGMMEGKLDGMVDGTIVAAGACVCALAVAKTAAREACSNFMVAWRAFEGPLLDATLVP